MVDTITARHFPEISWEFCFCVSLFSQGKRATHINKFGLHPFPGTGTGVLQEGLQGPEKSREN